MLIFCLIIINLGHGIALKRKTRILKNVVGNEKISLEAENVPDICTLSEAGGDFEYIVKVPPFLYAPIEKGEECGRLDVMCGGKSVCEIPLVSAEKCEKVKTAKKEKSQFQKLKSRFVKIIKQEK